MKKAVFILAVALVVSLVCNYKQCTQNDVVGDTVTVERIDTQYITKTDTMPVVKYERVTEYVTIPCPGDTADTAVVLPVVQRTFTDDSTYTAYVSGVQYEELPKLDSIFVLQRTIYKEVERTITVNNQPRISLSVQTGVGVGVFSRKPDIYIGLGVQWKITK